MALNVFANGRSIVHKGSGTMNFVFPDVCKTPTPGGPVPIPYPNIGKSGDTTKGPTTVKVNGKMPMVKKSLYSKTTGDEPGTVGGVISGVNKSVAEFMTHSFDVKFENRNVARMGDMMFHNKKNIMG
ncbi:MAG: DUF4150 domain-containing protein [Desulfobacterales bacterium]|nr:DUF4150 domain-containing protein [Desulfobacterales bacterium]